MILSLLLAGAAGFQDVRALDAAVAAFTGRPVGIEGRAFGRRCPAEAGAMPHRRAVLADRGA
ncbi:hypothetical protein P0F65_15150 [Sphingomonas sp. I4]